MVYAWCFMTHAVYFRIYATCRMTHGLNIEFMIYASRLVNNDVYLAFHNSYLIL